MVNRTALVNAMASTLLAIPEVVEALAPDDPVLAYIDLNPTSNQLDEALYQMQPGNCWWSGSRQTCYAAR